jgi:hypothetical protein
MRGTPALIRCRYLYEYLAMHLVFCAFTTLGNLHLLNHPDAQPSDWIGAALFTLCWIVWFFQFPTFRAYRIARQEGAVYSLWRIQGIAYLAVPGSVLLAVAWLVKRYFVF